MKTVEVQYIESGTFVGGEEDTSNADIERGEDCLVIKKESLSELQELAKTIQERVRKIETIRDHYDLRLMSATDCMREINRILNGSDSQ